MTPTFEMMAKPVGAQCNLNCVYCYYLEKEKLYPGEPSFWMMNEKVLELFIAQVIYSCREPVVQFAWHGGEPTLRGLDFFKNVIRLQKKHSGGRRIENSLQTNGTLLSDEWCRFFSDNQFLIGISIDGPEHCHDHYRMTRHGAGSFARCMKGLELLVKHKTEFNTLTVINDYNSKYPEAVYRFLKQIGSRYIQFLPVVEWINTGTGPRELSKLPPESGKTAEVTDWTVDPVDYGNFLITVFKEWVRKDVGDYFVITFESILANWMRVPPSVCVFAETCGHAGIVEYNGDVYSCDHYVFPTHKLGNILENSVQTLMGSPFQEQFGRNKRDRLPGFCLRCSYLDLCNGECPKNRIAVTPEGETGLNYLCRGFKNFFSYSEPYFDFMANELKNHRHPSTVKKWATER